MARASPRKIRRYTVEFKLTAVRLSARLGVHVKIVAAALDIHPFMLSKWRKEVRDGVLRGRPLPSRPRRSAASRSPPTRRCGAKSSASSGTTTRAGSTPRSDITRLTRSNALLSNSTVYETGARSRAGWMFAALASILSARSRALR
jgi:transposase-like protein